MARSVYLKLESRILRDEQGGILDRWKYGRECLKAKKGRQKLPDGFIADRLAEAERAGLKLSEREIQYRVQCAEVYGHDRQIRSSAAELGSWRALCDAGFPVVDVDESTDPEEIAAAAGISTEPPDSFEQLVLIPGFGETIKVRGRTIPIAEATVGDAKTYRETYRQIHANFGKTLAQIEAAVEAMEEGCAGDDDANAVEAWKRGNETDERPRDDDEPPPDPGDGIR